MGYTSIPESIAVDNEAKKARESGELYSSLETARQQMLHACAGLLIKISNLLSPRNGPSRRDRLSPDATANQASSDEDPETTLLLA